jgi:hypothetical protein
MLDTLAKKLLKKEGAVPANSGPSYLSLIGKNTERTKNATSRYLLSGWHTRSEMNTGFNYSYADRRQGAIICDENIP